MAAEATPRPKARKLGPYDRFICDMEAAGIPWRSYRGRWHYYGPAVEVGQDLPAAKVYRATRVKLQSDAMGLGSILYPAAVQLHWEMPDAADVDYCTDYEDEEE